MSEDVFQQLARNAFRRNFARLPALEVDTTWINAYVTALKEVTADQKSLAPGLVALLLDMVDDQRRVIEGLRAEKSKP